MLSDHRAVGGSHVTGTDNRCTVRGAVAAGPDCRRVNRRQALRQACHDLAAPAHRPQTIHVLEDPIAFTRVKLPGCTSAAGCKGDQLNGRCRMLDAATHGEVGTLLVKCVVIDPGQNLYHCPANTNTLSGLQRIQARAALTRDSENKDRAVDRRLSGIVPVVQDLGSVSP